MIQFEWDPEKARGNEKKHGIPFHEAATVFADNLSVTFPNSAHLVGEERYITIGISEFGKILLISHAESGDTIRIISARQATRRERKYYEEESQ